MQKVYLDGLPLEFEANEADLYYGIGDVLAISENDITQNQSWYEDGFCVMNLFSPDDFFILNDAVTNLMKKVLNKLAIEIPDNFNLKKYHHYIRNSDVIHQHVIEITREFQFSDLDYPLEEIVTNLSETLNLKLTSYNSILNRSFVIVRISRPNSNDFNPPHRDAYLDLWKKTINVWIPIEGVTKNSSLPVVPSSHLIAERFIKRSKPGTFVNGRPYRVPLISEWNSSNLLIRPIVNYGEGLVFSPYLIHGAAKNYEIDETRFALELRLSGCD
jgi:hypothetical protein